MKYLCLIFAILLSAAYGFSIQQTSINVNPTKIQLQQQGHAKVHRPCSIRQQISSHTRSRRKGNVLFDAATTDVQENNNSSISQTTSTSKPKEEEEEWEFEEYEMLTEADFYDSEWKVGTLMENSNKIEETWTRLVVQDGEFICIWGDGASGKWNFDSASQFMSMSKDSFGGWLGKKIWAGSVEDFYYVEGTIRGWSPISPASVVGQWQAKRLGVDRDEAGIAPWFEEEDDDEEEGGDNNVDSALSQAKEEKEGDN
mmetsp:Transcript_2305/g.2788  ORF Transcript_2305/g.2788 Transcript_2305/m.2788 type:complete len:256 (-) Transcript_2305:50-817(-)